MSWKFFWELHETFSNFFKLLGLFGVWTCHHYKGVKSCNYTIIMSTLFWLRKRERVQLFVGEREVFITFQSDYFKAQLVMAFTGTGWMGVSRLVGSTKKGPSLLSRIGPKWVIHTMSVSGSSPDFCHLSFGKTWGKSLGNIQYLVTMRLKIEKLFENKTCTL